MVSIIPAINISQLALSLTACYPANISIELNKYSHGFVIIARLYLALSHTVTEQQFVISSLYWPC